MIARNMPQKRVNGIFRDWDVIVTVSNKQRYHCEDDFFSIKLNIKGEKLQYQTTWYPIS